MRLFRYVEIAAIVIAFAACPVNSFAKPQDFGFIQSVGGIKLKSPTRSLKGWELPVEINVAGLKTVTTPPSLVNSGLACEKVGARVDGETIWIQVHTGTAKPGQSADCPAAMLGNLDPGYYHVFYEASPRDSLNSGPAQPATEIGTIMIVATDNGLY